MRIDWTEVWTEVEEADLNEDFLLETFLADAGQTVYVTDKQGGICGIITLGDLRRHLLKGAPLIKRDFLSASEREPEWAKEILKEKKNIFSIPVLDQDGHMLGQYRKEEEPDRYVFPAEILFRSWMPFLLPEEGGTNLIVTEFADESERLEAAQVMKKAAGRLDIVDRRKLPEVFRKCAAGLRYGRVYDCVREDYRVRELFYDRCRFRVLVPQEKDRDSVCGRLPEAFRLYESIAVLSGEADAFASLKESGLRIQPLDEDAFRFRPDRGCYEYTGRLEEVPETLGLTDCFLERPYILFGERVIPVVSGHFFIGDLDYYVSDYDIAYCIVPKLQKNGIKTVLIENVDERRGELAGFHAEEARKYRQTEDQRDKVRTFFGDWAEEEFDRFWKEYTGRQWYRKNGYLHMHDVNGSYINVCGGERFTVGNPESFRHTFWLFGPCIISGAYADDARTIASDLRKRIDRNWYIKNMGDAFVCLNLVIRDAELKQGDVVLIYTEHKEIYREAGLRTHSVWEAYSRCPDLMDHVLDTLNHVDWFLLRRVADEINQILIREKVFAADDAGKDGVPENSRAKAVHFGIRSRGSEIPEQLAEWLSAMEKYRGRDGQKTGAIVMNCNPFTLGHRYLIEEAVKRVDRLLIFVVEEDRSFFSFDDRIRMVRLGTQDLCKVTVVPSGRFIVSAQTLPGYFEKNDNPDVVFDATSDLELFAEVIADRLNISVRFAGEEPIDRYTRQYNHAMRELLPRYGIEFVEIPRKEEAGEVISASRVRKRMLDREYEEIKELVLPEIYQYLEEHYFEGVGSGKQEGGNAV